MDICAICTIALVVLIVILLVMKRISNQDLEISRLHSKIRDLNERIDNTHARIDFAIDTLMRMLEKRDR